MKVHRFLTVMLVASVLLSPGCATLTRGDKQNIPVTSSPAGAAVFVNGVRKGLTPTIILLKRGDKEQTVRIECAGYNPVEIRVLREYSSSHMLADGILGLVVGTVVAGAWYLENDETAPDLWLCIGTAMGTFILVDWATRAGYTLEPKDISVTLTKAGGTPRVDTILIEADDFRNIKWIRVHRD
jgi:hypothetical protein